MQLLGDGEERGVCMALTGAAPEVWEKKIGWTKLFQEMPGERTAIIFKKRPKKKKKIDNLGSPGVRERGMLNSVRAESRLPPEQLEGQQTLECPNNLRASLSRATMRFPCLDERVMYCTYL